MEENEPQRRMGAPGKPSGLPFRSLTFDDSNHIAIPKLDGLEKRVEALESRFVGKETAPATLDDVVEQIRRLDEVAEILIKNRDARAEAVAALDAMLNGFAGD